MMWGIGALWIAACVHHRPYWELHTLQGKHVLVETSQQETVPAVAELSADGVVFRDESGEIVAPGAISDVSEVRRVRGALEGLGIGISIGGTTGAVLGYADGDDCPGTRCFFKLTAPAKAALGALFLGSVGGAIGVLVGVIHGSYDTYAYSPPSPISPGQRSGSITRGPRITPTGPPGSVGGVTITW